MALDEEQLRELLLSQVRESQSVQSGTRASLEALLSGPNTPIQAMPATGLSPQALAALRGRAIDAVPGRFDEAQRNLTAKLSQRGLLTGQNAAAGDTSRLFGMLSSEREKTRASGLRDVTLADEDAYNKSLDRNEVMRSARENERISQLQQIISGYNTSLNSSDPDNLLAMLQQMISSGADRTSREGIAKSELSSRESLAKSESAAAADRLMQELASRTNTSDADRNALNTRTAADRALEERRLRMLEEQNRLDVIAKRNAAAGILPPVGGAPQTSVGGGGVLPPNSTGAYVNNAMSGAGLNAYIPNSGMYLGPRGPLTTIRDPSNLIPGLDDPKKKP